ncbi:hypothetical protein EH30_13075 [Erythrobacter sp. JL475]|nr:hypothetical protein EH30_13075 [Erythrobacter sp. JL475]
MNRVNALRLALPPDGHQHRLTDRHGASHSHAVWQFERSNSCSHGGGRMSRIEGLGRDRDLFADSQMGCSRLNIFPPLLQRVFVLVRCVGISIGRLIGMISGDDRLRHGRRPRQRQNIAIVRHGSVGGRQDTAAYLQIQRPREMKRPVRGRGDVEGPLE